MAYGNKGKGHDVDMMIYICQKGIISKASKTLGWEESAGSRATGTSGSRVEGKARTFCALRVLGVSLRCRRVSQPRRTFLLGRQRCASIVWSWELGDRLMDHGAHTCVGRWILLFCACCPSFDLLFSLVQTMNSRIGKY